MLGSHASPKQPCDLWILLCLHQEGENVDEKDWTERRGQRQDLLLFCYPVSEISVGLGGCHGHYCVATLIEVALLLLMVTKPGSVFFICSQSAAHDLRTLWSQVTVSQVCMCMRSVIAICCRMLNITSC